MPFLPIKTVLPIFKPIVGTHIAHASKALIIENLYLFSEISLANVSMIDGPIANNGIELLDERGSRKLSSLGFDEVANLL